VGVRLRQEPELTSQVRMMHHAYRQPAPHPRHDETSTCVLVSSWLGVEPAAMMHPTSLPVRDNAPYVGRFPLFCRRYCPLPPLPSPSTTIAITISYALTQRMLPASINPVCPLPRVPMPRMLPASTHPVCHLPRAPKRTRPTQ
jgi:hypothetical protein